MPACQINDHHHILAELQHNFHFLHLFNSKTTGLNFHHLFTLCRAISIATNAHIRNARVHSVSEVTAKSEDGQF